MPRLSDAEVVQIREMAAAGHPSSEIAPVFGVSVQYVRRLVSGTARPVVDRLESDERSTVREVQRLIESVGLDAHGRVVAETAVAVASKLDELRASSAVAAAAASAGLARQLLELVGYLREQDREPDELDEIRARREARRLALGFGRGMSRAS